LKYCAYESAHKTGYWYIYVEDREKLLDFEKKWDSLDRKKDEQVQLSLNIADWLDNQLDVKVTGLNIEKNLGAQKSFRLNHKTNAFY